MFAIVALVVAVAGDGPAPRVGPQLSRRIAHLTEKEAQRLYGHIVTLQNAEVPLKRVVVKDE